MLDNIRNDMKACRGDFVAQVITDLKLPCEAEAGHNYITDYFGATMVSEYATFGDNYRIPDGGVGCKTLEKSGVPAIIKVRNMPHLNMC